MIVSLNGIIGSEIFTLHPDNFSISVIHLYKWTSPQVPKTNSPESKAVTSSEGSHLYNRFIA